ncbi:glycine zipper 2TM domain-containing protein [Paraburkholderia tagetis]|uniref:Glycine zipper 2TM domain-containing protein n=1 Tax=Paraburkholderia tagetis TaxID=2913261 RepID=A0A9X1RXU9_9BURK|nr:glycine zipper 2TM domain-containing protein [Paraburkholderia tagetis]MCG5076788.1 glycine zipper 2TM domain-containing protein [Paraburkholderia tagetis]
MNTNPGPEMSPRTRIHPLVAGAAVAVILASATGIAAMTGWLPTTHASTPAITAQAAPAMATSGGVQPVAHQPASVQEPVRHEPVHHYHAAQAAPRHENASAWRGAAEPPAPRQVAVDPNAGSVVAINAVQAPEPTTGIGAVGGAVAGGLLGNQIGQGRGRTLATIAGAIGGGFAGNGIEHEVRKSTTYQVQVRMADGSYRNFTYPTQPQLTIGERVHVDGETLNAS